MTIEFGFVQSNSNTSTGTQAFTDSDMTVTPKLALLFCTYGTVAGTDRDEMNMSIGACTSADQWAISSNAETGQITSDNSSSLATDVCLQMYDEGTTTTLRMDAEYSSFGTGTVTINHKTAPDDDYIITAILIGGTDFEVDVGTVTPNATENSTASISSLAFQPEAGLFFQSRGNVANTFAQNDGCIGWGVLSYLSSTIVQRGYRYESPNGQGTTLISSHIASDRVALNISTSGAISDSVEVTGVGASSVTLTTRDGASPSDLAYCLMSTGDEKIYVGDFNSPNATGSDAVTGFGIQPRLALALSTRMVAQDTGYSGSTTGAWSIGVAIEDENSDLNLAAIRGADQDNVVTTNTESSTEDSYNIRATFHGGAANFLAATTSLDADGMTQNWTIHNDSSVRQGLVFAVGEPTPITGSPWYIYAQN